MTRKASKGGSWKLGTESCICNYHYDGYQGPMQKNPNLMPTLFKRPRSSSQYMATKRRRVLDRSGFSDDISDQEKESSETNEDLSEDTADVHVDLMYWKESSLDYQSEVDRLKRYIDELKKEVVLVQSKPQRLHVSLRDNEQLQMYTGLSTKVFSALLKWLQPVMHTTGQFPEGSRFSHRQLQSENPDDSDANASKSYPRRSCISF